MLAVHPADIECPEFDAWWEENKTDIELYRSKFGLRLEDFGKLVWTIAVRQHEHGLEAQTVEQPPVERKAAGSTPV